MEQQKVEKKLFRKGWITYYMTFLFLGAGLTLLTLYDPILFIALWLLYVSNDMYFSYKFDCYVLGEEEAEKCWL